jgi:hypothetical protein
MFIAHDLLKHSLAPLGAKYSGSYIPLLTELHNV